MTTRDDSTDDTHRIDDTQIVEQDRSSVREPFGPAQAVALAVGVFLIVTGALGLSRTGLDDLRSPAIEVAGMGMTPLLALVHVVLGAITLAGAAGRSAARSILMVLGPATIAGGIFALVAARDTVLGTNETSGVLYIAVGVVALLGAAMTPSAVISERIRGAHIGHAR